jgi:hypothetical protein
VLVYGEVFEGFNHRSGYVLSLEIGFENVYITIRPFKVLALNSSDTL